MILFPENTFIEYLCDLKVLLSSKNRSVYAAHKKIIEIN